MFFGVTPETNTKKTYLQKRLDCVLQYDIKIILGSTIKINWEAIYDHLMRMRIFTLMMNKTFM